MESYPTELLLIAGAAMLAPILAELPKAIRIPVVVLENTIGSPDWATCFWFGKSHRHGCHNGGTGIGLLVVYGWA